MACWNVGARELQAQYNKVSEARKAAMKPGTTGEYLFKG